MVRLSHRSRIVGWAAVLEQGGPNKPLGEGECPSVEKETNGAGTGKVEQKLGSSDCLWLHFTLLSTSVTPSEPENRLARWACALQSVPLASRFLSNDN